MIFALQNISEDKINSIKNNEKKIICISNHGIINLNWNHSFPDCIGFPNSIQQNSWPIDI